MIAFTPRQLRLDARRLLVLVPVLLVGCIDPVGNRSDPTPDPRFAVVVTNHSELLVYALLAVVPEPQSTLTWAIPVAPQSWDSLILDCNIDRVVPIGALVVDPLANLETLEVAIEGLSFVREVDFDCGSVITLRIDPAAGNNPQRPITADMQAAAGPADSAATSGFGPGGDSGFILVDAVAPRGVPAQVNLSWEGSESQIFQSVLTFGGPEGGFGFLLTCPVRRFALGELEDPSVPGATLTGSGDVIPAPPPLGQQELACGSTITLGLIPTANGSGDYRLALEASTNPTDQSISMYRVIRDVLESQGLLDRPSSLLSLLPPSIVTPETRY